MIRRNYTAVASDGPSSLWEIIERVAMWAIYVKTNGASNEKTLGAALIGPIIEKIFSFRLEDTLYQFESQKKQQVQPQQQEQTRKALIGKINTMRMGAPTIALPVASLAESTQPKVKEGWKVTDSKWLDVIEHPAVVLVVGKRNSGKSALAFRQLELYRNKLGLYVLKAPEHLEKLLPEWIGIKDVLEDIPSGSMVLVDEAHLLFNARDSQSPNNREISRIVNLARHKGLSIIFVTQEARNIDKNIVSAADVLVFKDMGILQSEFDRPQLRALAEKAKQAFNNINGNRNKFSYVYSPNADFEGLLENDLPTFWSNKLSKAYAAGLGSAEPRNPKKVTKEEKIQLARVKAEQGESYSQIAKELGASKGTAFNWINGYPYKDK
ncbi:helicase HerA-like domain-containing protein [Chloroflexota bacterium]